MMDQDKDQKYTTSERTWNDVMEFFKQQYGDIDLEGILFLIGVQELGKGYQKFNKAQKMDVMHVAICTLLEPYGFYTFEGSDAEGWPHWIATEKLPSLKAGQQTILMKTAVIDYFKTREII